MCIHSGRVCHHTELQTLIDAQSTSSQAYENDLVSHNLVVFRNGENALQVRVILIQTYSIVLLDVNMKLQSEFAMQMFHGPVNLLQVLPPLVDVIPEARLNLIIWHLKHGEVKQAFELIKDMQPTAPQVSVHVLNVSCATLVLIGNVCVRLN